MKKTISNILAFMMVLSIAGTALAAPANPFVDVPTNHWAYSAVAKLAQAGIIEGYTDNTFNGTKAITRYEMAQMVAKAMARSDKADAENKALIDKLAVEYADELQNLGVRISKLEDKTRIGFNYESRIRYAGDDNKAADKQGTNAFDFRQRIIASGAVNDNVSFGMRMEATGASGSGTANVGINRAYFDVKNFLGAFDNLRIGRFGTGGITNGLLNYSSSNNDGFIITKKMGATTFKSMIVDVLPGTTGPSGSSEYALYNLDFNIGSNLLMNIGYSAGNFTGITNWPVKKAPYTTAYNLETNSFDIGAQYKIGNMTLTGEYVSTKDKTNDTTPKAFAVQITNGVTGLLYPEKDIVNFSKPHTDAFALSYRSIEHNAVPYMSGFKGWDPACANVDNANTNTLAQDDNVKGYFFTYQNVVSKNVIWTVEYQSLKQKVGTDKDNLWSTHFQFFF